MSDPFKLTYKHKSAQSPKTLIFYIEKFPGDCSTYAIGKVFGDVTRIPKDVIAYALNIVFNKITADARYRKFCGTYLKESNTHSFFKQMEASEEQDWIGYHGASNLFFNWFLLDGNPGIKPEYHSLDVSYLNQEFKP